MSFTAKFKPDPRLRKRIARARDAAAEAVVAEVLRLARRRALRGIRASLPGAPPGRS